MRQFVSLEKRKAMKHIFTGFDLNGAIGLLALVRCLVNRLRSGWICGLSMGLRTTLSRSILASDTSSKQVNGGAQRCSVRSFIRGPNCTANTNNTLPERLEFCTA